MNKNLYERWQQKLVVNALKTRRVLLLVGAKKFGKTTLTRALGLQDAVYFTLDNLNVLEAAKRDPIGFVSSDSLVIIDEIQRVPELLLSIKEIVDKNNSPGQFILTGSSNIQSSPNVKESLAGRVRKVRLRGLSQGEINRVPANFFSNVFEKKINEKKVPCSQAEVLKRATAGSYPEALKLDGTEKKQWYRDYIDALLERDLKDIANVKHLDSMRDILPIMAAWSSKFFDISAIGSGLSISRNTIEAYINALECLFLIEKVRPWIKTDYERVNKKSKIFMNDCGMMSSLLNWKIEDLKFDGDKLGKLVETFVFNEVSAQMDAYPGEYTLYHYRDKDKREIDFIVEREDGHLLGIEVKSGSSISGKSFKHLEWFKNNLAKKPFIGIVLYTGEDVLPFGKDMYAVPMSYLWN